jgi:hypothetical protein
MKQMKRIAVVAVLGLAICGFAFAQSQHDAQGHGAADHHKDAASATKHLTEAYAKIASFDANKDGKLDATEKESIAKTIADGKLEIPDHTPPNGVKPSADKLLNHIAGVYAFLASKDANHDGTLDAKEQAAFKTAIENGELAKLHGKEQHDGPQH